MLHQNVSPGLSMSAFASTDVRPMTPKQMHQHIKYKIRFKKYYSITTLPAWAGWQALPANQQMETRPCFHGGSRIHTLSCGHTIAVARDAEPCAANCEGNETTVVKSAVFSNSVPTKHAATLEKIRKSIVAGVNAWADSLEANGDPNTDAKAEVTLDILKTVWACQLARIRPRPDLISGDYSCHKCGTVGHRETFPALVLPELPYACIVVGRDEEDHFVMAELEKKMQSGKPNIPSMTKKGNAKGPKRKMDQETFDRVRHGRITKQRVKEKERVIGQLREDNLWAEVGTLELSGMNHVEG